MFTSRQVRLEYASNICAIIPDTSGVALEVPPKPLVQSLLEYPDDPSISVVVIPEEPPSEGATIKRFAPGSE